MAIYPAEAALKDYIDTQVTEFTVLYEKERGSRPDNMPWILVRFVGGSDGIRGIGSEEQLREQDGLVHFLIHIPKNAGQLRASYISDTIAGKFLKLNLPAPADPDYLRTEPARVDHDVAVETEGSFDVTLLSVPYTFYHFR